MRSSLTLLHRWCGLFLAVFLFVAGATGAVIAWNHEIDAWLNPHLFKASSGAAAPLTPLELAQQLEETDARLWVSFLPLHIEPGRTLQLSVEPRLDPSTGKPFDLGFNQMALDPASGAVQGVRERGAISLSRENLMAFLFKLHFSLHIPDVNGLRLGMLVMGLVSIVWVLDCFVALWIAFPNPRSWAKSLTFRLGHGAAKLNFDLHRSGGVWTWALLLMLAVTSVSMNLEPVVVRPVVGLFSPLMPTPFEHRKAASLPIEPTLSREQAIALGQAEAYQRGWTVPAGGLFYTERYGLYGIAFFEPGQDHAEGGLGNPWLYIDGRTGSLAGEHVPGTGSAGDIFMQAQLPLHSGRILGLPGRILISLMGLAVATLSVTGVVIWARKRRAQARAALRQRDGTIRKVTPRQRT